ncbi:MAG: hypothetical protein ACI4EF_08600 [Coprococcus sp.]
MNVQERVIMCRFIDKMERNSDFSKKLGLENKSTFHGNPVDEKCRRKKR